MRRPDLAPLRRAAARAWTLGGRAIGAAAVWVWGIHAELLVAGAALAGWGCLTYGVAALTSPVAWPISIGILLLSLVGWRFAWTVASEGLYKLTRAKTDG